MHVDQMVELPPVDLPPIDVEDPMKVECDEIERLASQVRKAWGLGDGPISNVLWLMEHHGIVSSRLSLDATALDGLSQWIDGRPYVLITADVSAARSRFDAAHELGHLILHRKVPERIANSSDYFPHLESQAHRFAAAFTFPAASFAREAKPLTLEHFVDLKTRWRMSIKMMIRRAVDLHLIGAEQATSLSRGYSYRRWHGNEPLDDVLEPEQPRFLDKSMLMILENDVCSAEALEHELALHEPEIVRIACISRGRLAVRAPVLEMPAFRLRNNEGRGSDGPGVVLPFTPRKS